MNRLLARQLRRAACVAWLTCCVIDTGHAQTDARAAASSALGPTSYANREDALRFAAELVARQPELEANWVRHQIEAAQFVPAVARLIMPPPAGTAKDWAAYRARFLEQERIDAGVAFWSAHAAPLREAEDRWGVPASIVVGIIGVETYFGRVMGRHRVLDALATLSFDFPPGRSDRAPFFRAELEEFLLWCVREGRDPQAVRGSYAGAMGLPQFMPSSINRYAVDFDGDGHIDLTTNPTDAIGSVAHYLATFGWERGLPTHFRVHAPNDAAERAVLLGPDIVPTFTASEFSQRGAALAPEAYDQDTLLALVELQNGSMPPTYVAGTRNFYVITRYNWSSYYASAVIELANAVAQRRQAPMPGSMSSPSKLTNP
ncbi:MAG: lytic murein transglycosylase B [Aquincola sp.]|nr:lytic murein transglycosylase B [Aquincola sp.]MDH5328688.1 lytic murein transglycosylase B [Aquincola sp.]